jgi:hypothetical protein
MSISIMQQLFKLDLPKCEKAVVLAIASHLKERKPDAGAWPSQKRLQAMTGWGERSVQNAVTSLRDCGIIELIGRKKVGANWLPVYRCHPEGGVMHKLFTAAESDEIQLAVEPHTVQDTGGTATDAPHTAIQNATTRTPCGQTTCNKNLNNRVNKAEPFTPLLQNGKNLGDMTEEEFYPLRQKLWRFAVAKFGQHDALSRIEEFEAGFPPPRLRV